VWRFLLAGLVVVGGISLLFVGSFDDPTQLLRNLTPTPPSYDSARILPPPSNPQPPNITVQPSVPRRANDIDADLAAAAKTLREQAEQTRQELNDLHQQISTEQARLQAMRQMDAALDRIKPSDAPPPMASILVSPTEPKPVDPVKPVDPPKEAKSEPKKRVTPPPQPQAKSDTETLAVLFRLRRQQAPTGISRDEIDPPIPSPRRRLLDARAALLAGRIDAAESLLQQARMQLILRPNTPNEAVSGSYAGGQVAVALRMLNDGDVQQAIVMIDMAIEQAEREGIAGN